jgi:hypothetical protein
MVEHYGIYFTTPDNTTVELPVMPAEISVDRVMDVLQHDVVALGEVDQIGQRKLNETTIDGIIPVNPRDKKLITATSVLTTGSAYINLIEKWQDSKKPGRLVITGNRQISGRVTVSKFEWGMKDGNSNEYYFSLTIREWRDYAAKKLPVPKLPAVSGARFKVGDHVVLTGGANTSTDGIRFPGHLKETWGHIVSVTRYDFSVSHYTYGVDFEYVIWNVAEQDLAKRPVAPAQGTPRPAPPQKIGIGSRVIVNGRLFRDSYGTGGGLTERNAERVITLIANGRAKPYHVALVGGGDRGWVSADSVRLK